MALGHIGTDALSLVTLVGLITIAASTYMITWSHHLFAWCEPFLSVFERRHPSRESTEASLPDDAAPELVLFGLGRFGTAIGIGLAQRGIRVLGIDFNPEAIQRWRALGLEARHGDATDPEFVGGLPLAGARWLVSTVPVTPANLSMEDPRQTLAQTARSVGFVGRVAVASHHADEVDLMGGAGVDLVLDPFRDAADRAVELLCGATAMERKDFPLLPTEAPPSG